MKQTRPTVLVADADVTARRRLAKALAAQGCRVVEVGDGQAALAHLSQSRPDLMILDANLPALGGTELCFRTKRISKLKEVPVIITAFACDAEARARALRSRAERVLCKPLAPDEAAAAVGELLGTEASSS